MRPLEEGTKDKVGTRTEYLPKKWDYDHLAGPIQVPAFPRRDFGCGDVSFLPEYVEHACDLLNEFLYYAQAHGRPSPIRRKQLLATLAPLLRFPAVTAFAFPESPVDKSRWSQGDLLTTYRQAELWKEWQWPWSEQEDHYGRFLHDLNRCVYELLRQPLTLRDSAVGQTDAKASLLKLAERMAYVKSGNRTYAIQTLELTQTNPAVSEAEYRTCRQQILTQTRARYCRPRHEVETELWADVASPKTPPPLRNEADGRQVRRIRRSRPSS